MAAAAIVLRRQSETITTTDEVSLVDEVTSDEAGFCGTPLLDEACRREDRG
jgi:hypothetical protein